MGGCLLIFEGWIEQDCGGRGNLLSYLDLPLDFGTLGLSSRTGTHTIAPLVQTQDCITLAFLGVQLADVRSWLHSLKSQFLWWISIVIFCWFCFFRKLWQTKHTKDTWRPRNYFVSGIHRWIKRWENVVVKARDIDIGQPEFKPQFCPSSPEWPCLPVPLRSLFLSSPKWCWDRVVSQNKNRETETLKQQFAAIW